MALNDIDMIYSKKNLSQIVNKGKADLFWCEFRDKSQTKISLLSEPTSLSYNYFRAFYANWNWKEVTTIFQLFLVVNLMKLATMFWFHQPYNEMVDLQYIY